MQIVPILDDELLSGYRGRLANLNNCRQVLELQALMKARFPVQQADGQSHFVANVGAALNRSVRDLVDGHTLWPLFATFPEADTSSKEDRTPYSNNHAHLWMRSARDRMALCPACIAADLEDPDLHFSYWRRAHQVPGLMHCQQHGDALQFVEPPAEIGLFPHELMDAAKPAAEPALHFSRNSPVAQRTVALLFKVLTGAVMRHRPSVTNALNERAQQLAGVDASWGIPRALSERISAEVDEHWLKDLRPHQKGGRRVANGRQIFFQSVLGVPSGALSAAAAALVAALVFETVEEAAQALFTQI